ncbi:VanZ family protein [Trichloromonas sp.]|uniref:VanZ family protein n=1 Tax=Trichloromonas sp. TaxID=3069249 RepID=UPI003D81ADD8
MLLLTVSVGILWLSLTSSPPVFDAPVLGWDKAQHALAYGVLVLATGRFLCMCNLPARYAWGIAVVYAIGFGGLLEVLQGVAGTGRICEWGDLLADSIGALFAGIAGLNMYRRDKG